MRLIKKIGFVCIAGTLTGILSFCVSCGTGTPLLDRILANKIVFHGQVLDLDGNPVPNAKITYSGFSAAHYENAWTGGGPPDKIKYADENGCFEIRETGFTFDALVYPKLASRPTEYTRTSICVLATLRDAIFSPETISVRFSVFRGSFFGENSRQDTKARSKKKRSRRVRRRERFKVRQRAIFYFARIG